MQSIRIDRAKRLAHEPHLGHNRFHPDIAPVVEVGEGEEVALETRDALDGQITPETTVADFPSLDAGADTPADRPGLCQGCRTGRHPRNRVHRHHRAAGRVQHDHAGPRLSARCDDRAVPRALADPRRLGDLGRDPGVRIPGGPFMGVSGVAPSAEKLAEWTAREQRVIDKGGLAFPPDAAGAVPTGPCGLAGLRTVPPRENGGNFDVKQLTKARSCFSRSSKRAVCSRPATAILRRATARSV